MQHESAPIIDKEFKAKLFENFDASITEDRCKEQMLRQQEIAFLFKMNFGQGKIDMIHHCQEIGGTLWRQERLFGAIQGIQKDGTCIVTPDLSQIFGTSENDNQVPTVEDLMAIRSPNEIDRLQVSPALSYTARNIIPIPPFMINRLSLTIQATQGDSKAVLIEAINSMREFDDEMSRIVGEEIESAKDSCRDLIFWLFLVTKNKVYSTPMIACCDVRVQSHFKTLEKANLTRSLPIQDSNHISSQSQQDIQKPLEVIANSSSITRDYLDKLTEMQTSNSADKPGKSFKKIAKKYQQMILVASSKGDVVGTDVSEEGREFFKQSSSLLAQIFLNSYLEARDIECTITSAQATILLHGSFLWSNAVTPSGLSASIISTKDIMGNDTLYEGIVLDYSTKYEINEESLSKLTKTQVIYPVDIESTIHRLDALAALCELFFGDGSWIHKGLDELVYLCKQNKTLLKKKLALDDMFIPKLLYSVDDRVNQWLSQCCREDTVENTTLELVSFSNIIYKLQLNEFVCNLPANIRRIVKDTNPSKKRDSDIGVPNKQTKKTKQEAVMIRNEDAEDSWKLKPGEKWNQVFRHKSRDGPLLSTNCKVCLKYHVKGFCFNDCNFRGSHTKLSGDDFLKTDEYIKSLRN